MPRSLPRKPALQKPLPNDALRIVSIGGMSGAVIPVLLAIGVCVCVFLVAWWLVGKLYFLRPVSQLVQKSEALVTHGTRHRECEIAVC